GGKPWQQEPNDWRWCFGVNVFGMAICTSTFVPRMIAAGRPGPVVQPASGDGGFAPVPMASVYAASKAAVSCFTESLHHNLVSEGTALRAPVFYPSAALVRTGLFTAPRNPPAPPPPAPRGPPPPPPGRRHRPPRGPTPPRHAPVAAAPACSEALIQVRG